VLPNVTNRATTQIAEARQQYTSNMETFKACNLIKGTIIQQINTAIDKDCLANLIDKETRLLEGRVPQIMQELFNTNGAITPQTLVAAKTEVEAKTYKKARLILNIFTAISNYANKAEAAEAAETTPQLINIDLIIITQSTIFASNIRRWHSKPEDNKPWPNFKNHIKTHKKKSRRANLPSLQTPLDSMNRQTPPPSPAKSSIL
jgi:hypothetical protein